MEYSFRQEDDKEFGAFLAALRLGDMARCSEKVCVSALSCLTNTLSVLSSPSVLPISYSLHSILTVAFYSHCSYAAGSILSAVFG